MLRQEVVNIWIFVFLAKQNISTDWEPKNSAERAMLLASNFSWLFLAALKLFLDFLSISKNAQKIKCSWHFAGVWHLSDHFFLNLYDFNIGTICYDCLLFEFWLKSSKTLLPYSAQYVFSVDSQLVIAQHLTQCTPMLDQ